MPKRKARQPGYSLTALFWVCMFLMVLGALAAIAGITGSETEVEVAGAAVTSTNVGLVILLIASALLALIINRLPKEVELFGPNPSGPTLLKRISSLGTFPWLLLAAVALVLLLVRVMV